MREPDPSLVAMAKMFEARGITGPDKHDIIVVKRGRRVRLMEIAQGPKGVEALVGEASERSFKTRLRTLDAGHNLGLIQVITGNDVQCIDFLIEVTALAKQKHFSVMSMIGPRPLNVIWDEFFDAGGKAAGNA